METRSLSSEAWQALDASKRRVLEQRLHKARTMRDDAFDNAAAREPGLMSPLSSAQERLWLIEKLQPGTALYNVAEVFRIDGNLDIPALEQSIAEMLRRHDTLRTEFLENDGETLQSIRPTVAFRLIVTEIDGSDPEQRERHAQEHLAEKLRASFDLDRDLLFRVVLIRVHEDSYILALVMHHIVTDGWSDGILLSELFDCYQKLKNRQALALRPLRMRYIDFARWQRAWLNNGSYPRVLGYWKKKLAGVPAASGLPEDFPRPIAQNVHGAQQRFVIDAEVNRRVNALSAAEGCTPFMVLLATFKVLLHRWTQREDILVGSPVANRNQPEFEHVVGCFLNMVVLRTKLQTEDTFRDVLRKVRETALEAFAYQDLPFERLVMELRPVRSPNVNPFFQAAFLFEHFAGREPQVPGLRISRLEVDTKTSKFDFTLVIAPADGVLNGIVEYKTDLFAETTITRLIKDYQSLLGSFTSNSDRQINCSLP